MSSIIIDSSADSVLEGTMGNDLLIGGFGEDIIVGEEGSDVLFGDVVTGELGNSSAIAQGIDIVATQLFEELGVENVAVPLPEPGDIKAITISAQGEDVEVDPIETGEFALIEATTDEAIAFSSVGDGNAIVVDNSGDGSVFLEALGDSNTIIVNNTGSGNLVFDNNIGSDNNIIINNTGSGEVVFNGDFGINNNIVVSQEIESSSDLNMLFSNNYQVVSDLSSVEDSLSTLSSLGNEVVQGQTSNDDLLVGGLGDDVLFGEEGDDFLVGGQGQDFLVGGAGNDLFEFDVSDLDGSTDIINDFTVGEDSIRIIGAGDTVRYDSTTGQIIVDGSAIAQVNPGLELTEGEDFELL